MTKLKATPLGDNGCPIIAIFKHLHLRCGAMEMWCYRRMLRIHWTDKKTNISILEQLNLKRELMRSIKRRKLRFYGHTYRVDGIAETAICGIYPEKRRCGRHRVRRQHPGMVGLLNGRKCANRVEPGTLEEEGGDCAA